MTLGRASWLGSTTTCGDRSTRSSGFGRLLEAEDLTPDQRECVDQIVLGGERLQALITAALGSP